MSKLKNHKCDIDTMVNALTMFKDKHGNLPVVLAERHKEFKECGTFDIVEKLSISMCKIGKNKQIVITDIFN